MGALLLVGRLSVPTTLAGSLIAIIALMHGLAHGTEVPASASAYSYLVGMIAATGTLHGLGLGLGLMLNRAKTSWLLRVYGAVTSMVGAWLLFA
jgi:urease accessory protein